MLTNIYSGLLWCSVYDAQGNHIKKAEDIFFVENEDLLMDISNYMYSHVSKFILEGDFQAGFGGDDMDGCVDYATPKPCPIIPEMPFEVNGRKYTMVYSYPLNTIVE
jgi:hypothetical protein